MPYITRQDDISVLPLSVRSLNCLRHAEITTVGEMLDFPINQLITIRSMGKKSVEEVQFWIKNLPSGIGAYTLMDSCDDSDHGDNNQTSSVTKAVVFLSETGAVVDDIPIEKTPLSVRAKNSLTHDGILFTSQLVGKTVQDLLPLKNMGRKTAEEILNYLTKVMVTYTSEEGNVEQDKSSCQNAIVSELLASYGQTESTWSKELLAIQEQYPEAVGEALIYRLYNSQFVRATAKTTILQIIESNRNVISKSNLSEQLPNHLSNTTVLEELLLELEAVSAVEIGDIMIYRQYPSIVQFARQIKDDRTRDVIQARLGGQTLQEIGDRYSMTREGIRQIMKKGLRKKPYLREDKYSYIFEHYDFSVEDFMLAYDEPTECYYYLEIISKSARAKRKPIEEILTDTLVSPEMRKKAEKAIYRSYIATDGVHVKTTRQTLAKHFVKTRCKSLTKYDDFVREYNLWLDGLGLGDNFSLTIESRGYENILNQCDYVLWNQWRSFRYYNIVDQDFGELLSTIDFDQFQNTEISSLKLFRDYKELMQQYDIHDEYELHNLLKKIWSNENGQVAFRKMPTIEVGIPDRDEQVLSLLLQYAPISAENLSTKYEEAYGIKAASVLANYLGCLDVYYFDGVYSITSDNLPPIQFERMKDVLTDVFYTISDVKRLFLREFPDADTSSINPYTLKTLGFRVYSGYVVKNTYPSAVDYFRELLTTEDVVNAKALSRSVLNVVAYSSELYRLRSNYEIVEYAPLQYINIRRLNAAGITVEHFKKYCSDVAAYHEKGEYFTVKSMHQNGFTHELDDLGFDEWFYSSVLLEDRNCFSYQRIGGSRIFLRGKSGATLGDMLVWLLEQRQKIDLYDLIDLLEDHYGISLPKEKLMEIISGTTLYYDTIMEAVYIDYDTYFEEI